MEVNQALEKKASAHKARIQILENEIRRMKEHLQVALDKSNSDDQLLDALRSEISKLQQKVKGQEDGGQLHASSRRAAASMSAPGLRNTATDSRQLEELQAKEQQYKSELQRLQRLCKNQAEQLDSQDVTIRELRKKMNPDY